MSHPDPRPIHARYLDPLELVWLATARRFGLHVRRNPAIFSATDGTGLLELGPRDTLDPDDTVAQMLFHELCHWITNGPETFHERDWGFPLEGDHDWREYSGLRLQACLAGRYGLRQMLAPTSMYRAYYDRIPDDPLEPLDAGSHEARIVARAREAIARADAPPFAGPLQEALQATARLREVVAPFLGDYATEIPDDALPSLWGR